MKTNRQIQTWLRCAAALLLVLTGGLTTLAQEIEGGEAFYIYQNDGHFDGFFYDQVKQINYSRYDTRGVEYDKYVSQEIVTEDSVYRIMLSAIDSVSFVQPEIKFAEGVRFMRDEGMMAYYQSISKPDDDSFLLRFNGSMPASLRPKVGDVLSCPDLKDYDEAFVGKVKKVRTEGSDLVVECGYIDDLKDVFEQFITVEQVRKIDTPEGSRVRRRIAGLPSRQNRVEGNINDFTLFDFSTSFEVSTNITDNLSLSLGLNVGFGMTLTAVYKINWLDFYLKTETKEQVSLGLSFGLDGELYESIDPSTLPGIGDFVKTFSRIPIPASFPILYANMTPLPFTRAEAHLVVNVNAGLTVKSLVQSMELKSEWPYLTIRGGFLPAPFLPLTFEPETSFSVNAQINGMVQTGVKFPIELGTQEWFKRLTQLKAGTTVYAGPKISGALNFDLLKTLVSAYETLKDSKVELALMSIDTEFSSKGSIFGKEVEFKKGSNASFGKHEFTLFAGVENMECELKGDNMDVVHCKYDTSGDVCVPQRLGVGLYVKETEEDVFYRKLFRKESRDETYFLNTFNNVEVEFADVPAGEYRVRPVVFIAGLGDIPVMTEEKTVIIAPKELTLKPDEITAEEEGGTFDVTLVTAIDMPITAEPENNWVHVEVVKPAQGKKYSTLKVKVDENNTDSYRTTKVIVRQRYSPTEFDEKVLTVNQYGGLQLSKNKIEYEASGGVDVVKILTSYKPITIDLGDAKDWLSYDLTDRVLTVTAKSNPGANRNAIITVAAWSEKHKGISTVNLTVSQKGVVDAVVIPTELTYPFSGGTQRVDVKTGKDVTFTNVVISSGDDSWLIVEKQNDHFNVTALPNTGKEERAGTVTAKFSTKDASGKTVTADIPVTVTQGASTASVTPQLLTFSADGGTQTITFDHSGWSYYGADVADEHASWLSAKTTADGNVTVTVKKNTSGGRREGTVFCYVTNEQNPTNEQILYLPVTVKQASDVPEPPYMNVEGLTTLGYRAQVYRLKLDTNLPKVTAETNVSWASASVVDGEVILSVERNRAFEDRSGYLMVYGYDDNDKMQKASAIPLSQGYNGILQQLMQTTNIVVGFKGAINGSWTDSDGKAHSVDYGSGLATVPTERNRWKTTCTESGEYGAHIVANYDYEDEKLSVDIIIDDVDEGTINSLVYSYDYASDGKYRHTRLEAANIPRNGGNSGDGTVIKTLTERTARMWGLVSEKTGPYFNMDITTSVNGVKGKDFSLTVLIQK